MRELIEKQIVQSADFIAHDRIISASGRAKAYSDLSGLVKEAAGILGETDIRGWLKRMGIACSEFLPEGESQGVAERKNL